jgi:hypothetical protein
VDSRFNALSSLVTPALARYHVRRPTGVKSGHSKKVFHKIRPVRRQGVLILREMIRATRVTYAPERPESPGG